MARRIEQVNDLLREKIAYAIESDLEVPEVLVTVTRVDCSPDLKDAKVWLSVLPDNKTGSTLTKIKKQQGLIYTYLKKKTVLNRIPHLEFIFDDTEKNAAVIEDIIKKFED